LEGEECAASLLVRRLISPRPSSVKFEYIMNHEDFCNWLKGYLELANPAEIREREIGIILEHLELTKKDRFSDPPYYPNSLIGNLDDFGAEILSLISIAEGKGSESAITAGEGGVFVHGWVGFVFSHNKF